MGDNYSVQDDVLIHTYIEKWGLPDSLHIPRVSLHVRREKESSPGFSSGPLGSGPYF